MFGAICGDVLGAPYEVHQVKFKDFELLNDNARFTDDTVCTVAVASAIMNGKLDFSGELRKWGRRFEAGYGEQFERWLHSDHAINDSAGNGAVMRVSSIAWLAPTLEIALDWAAQSALNSHHHPESVRAAQAVVATARLSLEGFSKKKLLPLIEKVYGYDLSTPLDVQRPDAVFELLAEKTAPVAIRAFFEGKDFEDVLRLAISMGGDADTLAATAGGIAETIYVIPHEIRDHVMERLHPVLKEVVVKFQKNLASETALMELLAVRPSDAEALMMRQWDKWRIEALPSNSFARKYAKAKHRWSLRWNNAVNPVKYGWHNLVYDFKGKFR